MCHVDAARSHTPAPRPLAITAPAPIEPDREAVPSLADTSSGQASDGVALLTTPADPVHPDPWVTLPNGNVVPAGQADPYYD